MIFKLINLDAGSVNRFHLSESSVLFFRALIAGGGAPEIELCLKLAQFAQTVTGVDAYCYR